MAFTAKILSWRFYHLNIVGCLFKRRPTQGRVTGTPGPPPPPATPLICDELCLLLQTVPWVAHTDR